MDTDNIIKEKFRKYKLDKDDYTIISVRLNPDDLKEFLAYKKLIKEEKDSSVFKIAVSHSKNVIQRDFSGRLRIKITRTSISKHQQPSEENQEK